MQALPVNAEEAEHACAKAVLAQHRMVKGPACGDMCIAPAKILRLARGLARAVT